ncbi:hypothetical protein [uncultured Chryseobacterium sp.]|uniref:hypothetical protein n=1 Tax=uncultured Chryseobacterium sp. TaxID=259322 RepID=UPI00260F82A7|nr:hypothetical protein [uncultured Chryseobacterium sp.]
MMTSEQRERLINRLKGRNLPLDLFVEIEDHMSEQIDYKMHFGNKNFDSALDQTFAEWSSELEMKSVFWAGEKRTKIHRQTINQTQKNLFLRSLKYFVIPFAVSIVLLLVNKTWAEYFILMLNCSALLAGIAITFFDFKTIKSTYNFYNQKRISYLQKGVGMMTVSIFVILAFVLRIYENWFERLYVGFSEMLSFNISFEGFSAFLMLFGYFLLAINGFLYYLEYRKTIKVLQQKTNLKL